MEYMRYLMKGDEAAAAAHTNALWDEVEKRPDGEHGRIISNYLLSHRLVPPEEVPIHSANMMEGRVPPITIIEQSTRGTGLMRVLAVLLLLLLLPAWYLAYKAWQRGRELENLADQNGRIESALGRLAGDLEQFRAGTIGEQGVATNIRRELNPGMMLNSQQATAGSALREIVNRLPESGKITAPAAITAPPVSAPHIPANIATRADVEELARQCREARPGAVATGPGGGLTPSQIADACVDAARGQFSCGGAQDLRQVRSWIESGMKTCVDAIAAKKMVVVNAINPNSQSYVDRAPVGGSDD